MIANLLKKMMSRCGHKTFVHTIKIIYTYYLAMRVLYCFYFYRFGGVGPDRVVILTPNNHEGTSNASTNFVEAFGNAVARSTFLKGLLC